MPDFSALIVGTEIDGEPTSVGKVGSGFTERVRRQINDFLWAHLRETPAVPSRTRGTWVEPKLYCLVRCMERTPGEEIFAEAAARTEPAERDRYLRDACRADASLRARVEALLAALDHAGDFLAFADRPATDTPGVTEATGNTIGRYKLLEQIGEGGFGIVFMAEQLAPVRRRVALKIIKLGMDTKQVIARFEAERQALAMMDHESIARVFDAGVTDSGRPYFVMELIKGIPITTYCDQNNLSVRERLDLFIKLCDAVQHAHQKGVIHRDLKPTNVMVTVADHGPVPKVIDFGVAKATAVRLTDATLFTGFRQIIGTPTHMSPEQAQFGSVDVDTRSDVYSLGVLLYELLTGTTPFGPDELRRAAYDEMQRIIRDVEPPRPSTRLSTLETLPSVAARRGTEPRKLSASVRGELDWIVMRCLEKDRARRYQTASGLAHDLQRHLRDEPVQARPATVSYRFRKFARRNQRLIATAVLAACGLVAAVVVLSVSNVTVTRERNRTARALADREAALATAREKEAFANEQATLAGRKFYAAQVNLANQAIEAANLARGVELLETLRPKTGEPDMRTFEWIHLFARCNARHLMTIKADAEGIADLHFTPDGKLLISGGHDHTLRFWDADTGHAVRSVPTGDYVGRFIFMPGGDTLASIDNGRWVRMWDLATMTVLEKFHPTNDVIKTLAASPDRRLFAVGDLVGRIYLWDQSKRDRRQPTTMAVPNYASVLAFSPDSKTLVTGTPWRNAVYWDVTADPPQRRGETGVIMTQATFSSDGKTMASAGGGDVALIDTSTWKVLASAYAHDGYVTGLRYTPDERSVITSGQDRSIVRWAVPTPAAASPTTAPAVLEPHVIGAHKTPLTCIAVAPDGTRVAAGDAEGLIRFWDLSSADRLPLTNFRHGKTTRALLQLGDGRLLSSAEADARIWNETGHELARFGATGHAALTPDRKLLLSSPESGKLQLWDMGSLQRIASVDAHRGRIFTVAVSPDGKTAATGADGDNRLRLWNIDPGGLTHQADVNIEYAAASAAFSPDGRTIAIGGHYQTIFLDLATGSQRRFPSADKGFRYTWATVFSPDGKLVATAGEAGTAQLRDLASGQVLRTFKGHFNGIRSLAFSPDGQTLATGSTDRTVRLWDVATGQERLTFTGYTDAVASLSFSPDGQRLYTSSLQGVIRIYHAPRPKE